MANICTTNVDILFENIKDATTVFNKINEWSKTKDGKQDTWVEHIRDNSHTCDDWKVPPYGGGDIVEMTLNKEDNQINICLECRRSPVAYVFKVMLDETFPDMNFEILYRAEELSEEIYWTNDASYDGTYVVDCCSNRIDDVFYVDTEQEVEDILRDVLSEYGTYNEMTLPDLIDIANKNDLAYVHHYENTPLDELD